MNFVSVGRRNTALDHSAHLHCSDQEDVRGSEHAYKETAINEKPMFIRHL